MKGKQVSILLVGIGGYGNRYVEELLKATDDSQFTIAGVVEVNPDRSRYVQQLQDRGITFYADMESFYASSGADLAIISTPIQFHCQHVCTALLNGSHVLCEKPIAATVQDAQKMIDARNQSGKFVAVGYNLSFNDQIQELKRDILSGAFGKPKRLKTLVLWRRPLAYFQSGWKGKRKSVSGDWILDSVAHNATAHFLHNMFYLTGSRTDASAKLQYVAAELYRANDIETFDTCALRVKTEDDVEILFYTSHTILNNEGPVFSFEFEKASISFAEGRNENQIKAVFHDGTEKVYASTGTAACEDKLRVCIGALASGSNEIPCGLEAAYPQLLCVNAMMEAIPEVPGFPKALVGLDEETNAVWVDGLEDVLKNCFEQGVLPSEAGIPWAVPARTADLTDYRIFKG
ncbi:Gfo/Idh/MocA family protein [Paenibacillus radicis (ex Xue et al. 2023)]|uniref:Gfo/Idh/MocA family oxidoreductase n=1 Tax=Paenibacillus radicis (ex Xue et al. 2023) TaxID=2972489 RepID=A0ABT1YEB3_9BACL|nr:Gfo/Idh/MocA family oxidoreductase [Paenibacillus radicis (ex Xue et al. 2023)]MCR8631519.1 Gfo/Idh/MocA family oxidoreductase [Paenibacillus radicis (ex Xue et al. 2023)]